MSFVLDQASRIGALTPTLSPGDFAAFRSLIYQQTGISLAETKISMLSARLSKRLRQLGMESFDTYLRFVESEPPGGEELRELINAVTTNKTSFFREDHHFKFLSAQLRLRNTLTSPLRIWSSACSTGQEPYSIAMVLADVIPAWQGRDIRVLASDIDTNVLREAEEGWYEASALADIPVSFQGRYLETEPRSGAHGFRITQPLRDLITFRNKNLNGTKWEINTKFDFVFCRNVLIYFDHATQDRILRRFISYLKPEGYLIVGHSEHLNWLNNLIEPVGKTIYRVRKSS